MPESGYNTIQHYYRNTTGGTPALAQGELAINTFDESLWYADHDGDEYEVPLINLIGTTGVVQTQLNAKQATLTFGIASGNAVKTSVLCVDDEWARFTSTGLESRTNAELVSSIGALSTSSDFTMATDKKALFRDAAIYIHSSADGQLDIVADTEIQIAATTIDINGNVDISGNITNANWTGDSIGVSYTAAKCTDADADETSANTCDTPHIVTNMSWTAGTTAGPRCDSSTGSNSVIPSASASASGIVTTGSQSFAGAKTFSGGIADSGTISAGTWSGTSIVVGKTAAKCTDADADETSANTCDTPNIVTAITWSAGTTAGPTLNTDGNNVAIPVAASGASGVVTTGAQTFAGNKTFSGSTALGTPASGDLSNCSGLAGISGTLGIANGGTGATALTNLITLTTHTTGNYVGTITGGDGITSSAATSGEGTTHSLSATGVLYGSAGLGGPDNLDTLTNDSASGDKLLIYDISGTPAWKQITAANLFTNHGGGGGGSGTINSGSTNEVAHYTGEGTTVGGHSGFTYDPSGQNVAIGNHLTAASATLSGTLEIDVGSGDPMIIFDTAGADKFTMGVDDTDADKFKINSGSTLATTSDFMMDSSGNVTIAGDLTISGNDLYMASNTSGYILVADGTSFDTVAVSGDATISSGGSITIANDAITLAMMASGTDGNIISYDASGNPVAIATGSDGQVLTSTGAGSPPAFEDAGGGGGGDIDISGTPANKQLAVWTDADTLKGSTTFSIETAGLECDLAVYPGTNDTYTLGTLSKNWQTLWISDTIFIGASGSLELASGTDINTAASNSELASGTTPFANIYGTQYYSGSPSGPGMSTGTSVDVTYSAPFANDLNIVTVGGIVINCVSLPGSDESIKEDIALYIPTGLSLLSQLTPKSYKFKDDYKIAIGMQPDAKTRYGYIAQDLQAIDASYVKSIPDPRDTDNNILTITDDFYADVSQSQIKAIQELLAKNDALEARIAALEAA